MSSSRALILVAICVLLCGAAKVSAQSDIKIHCMDPLYNPLDLANLQVCSALPKLRIAGNERSSLSFILVLPAAVSDLEISYQFDTPDAQAGIANTRFLMAWYRDAKAAASITKHPGKRQLRYEVLAADRTLIRTDPSTLSNQLKTASGYRNPSRDRIDLADPASRIADLSTPNVGPLAAGEKLWVWMDINRDRHLDTGVYRGRVNLVSKTQAIRVSLALEIEVLPITLAEPVLEYSIYYRSAMQSGPSLKPFDLRDEAVMEAELRNLHDHGIRNPTIYEPVTSVASLDRILQIRSRAGIANEKLYLLGVATDNYADSAGAAKKRQLLLSLGKHLQNQGVREIYVYGIDEAEPEIIRKQVPMWSDLQSVGIRIFAASWQRNFHTHLGGHVDLAVVGQRPDMKINDYYHARRTRVFLYNNPQSGIVDPLVYRRNYGLGAWRTGFDGVMPYAYQHPMGVIWDDADHTRFRDHVFAFPTSDGVLDTLQWEGFSAGVDDVRYISTLMQIAAFTEDAQLRDTIEVFRSQSLATLQQARAALVDLILDACTRHRLKKPAPCRI